MRQGGLCMTLEKLVASNANHSGIMRESLAMVRNNLQESKNDIKNLTVGTILCFLGAPEKLLQLLQPWLGH